MLNSRTNSLSYVSNCVAKIQSFWAYAILLLVIGSLCGMEKSLPSILPDEVQLIDKTTKRPVATVKKSYLPFYDPLLESSPGSIELELPGDVRRLFLSLLALHNMDLTNYAYCYRSALEGFETSTREALQVWKTLDFIGYEHDDALCTEIVDYVARQEGPKESVSGSLKSCSKQLLTDIAKSYYLQEGCLPDSEYLKQNFEGVTISESLKNKSLIAVYWNSVEIHSHLKSISGLGELLKKNKGICQIVFKPGSLNNCNFDSDLIEVKENPIRKLWLSNNNLQMISLNNFSSLYILGLNSCKLKSLPDTIFKDCKNLTALYLKNNELTQLPTSIYKTNVIELDIAHNNFTELPKLYRMRRLRRLLAAHNNIEKIPENSFDGDCFILTYETRKQFGYLVIDLSSNKIASDGIDLYFIKNLKKHIYSGKPRITDRLSYIIHDNKHPVDIFIDLDDNPMPEKEFKDFCKTINKLVDKKHNF